jgi:hypothetical protein
VLDDRLLHQRERWLDGAGGADDDAPAGANSRRISATAWLRSGMNMRPIWHSTTSKRSSSNGIDVASPTCHSMGGGLAGAGVAAATSIISAARSMPVTDPVDPTRSAASRAITPVPQATSSTCSPGCRAAASSRPVEMGVAMAGTK